MDILGEAGELLEEVGEGLVNGVKQFANSVAASAETLGTGVAEGNIQVMGEAAAELLVEGGEAVVALAP